MGESSKNIVMDGDMMINKKIGEVLDLEFCILERKILNRFL